MADARYVVGIDLGTTNCVLAYVDTAALAAGTEAPAGRRCSPCRSSSSPAWSRRATQLPSFLYLPAANE